MSYHANIPTAEATVLVDILAELGAVFYVKTTTPTAMMMMETVSNVCGDTTNPHHSGCSSGGSIRIPSAFNGLFGLKPS